MGKVFRRTVEDDLEKLTDIYNQAIVNGNCTADMKPFTVEQRMNWFYEHDHPKYSLFTCEADGKIVGYGSLSAYRPGRQAVEHVAEVSCYLDFAERGKGIGQFIIVSLIQEAKERGIETLLAIILESNTASMKLLEKNQFQRWGRLPEIVHMKDRTTSHLYYGLNLSGILKESSYVIK